jgi:hypothetical protein
MHTQEAMAGGRPNTRRGWVVPTSPSFLDERAVETANSSFGLAEVAASARLRRDPLPGPENREREIREGMDEVWAEALLLFEQGQRDQDGTLWFGDPVLVLRAPGLPAVFTGNLVVLCRLKGAPRTSLRVSLDHASSSGYVRQLPPRAVELDDYGNGMLYGPIVGLRFDVEGPHVFRLRVDGDEMARHTLNVVRDDAASSENWRVDSP